METRSYWFALHVRPRFEKQTCDLLRRKGYEVFLPLRRGTRRRRNPLKEEELNAALFPGYLFCRFDPIVRLPVLMTPGVIKAVSLGNVPAPIPDHEIWAIERAVAARARLHVIPLVAAGRRVRISSGPLSGLDGTALFHKSKARLIISVELLQRSVAIEVDFDQVVCMPLVARA